MNGGERLVDICVRQVQTVLRLVRENPKDKRLQNAANSIYQQIATAPSDLIPLLLTGIDHTQLIAIEHAAHAQGYRIATEPFWKDMCFCEFGVSKKSSPDVTWRMTYEASRRAAALKREEEWLEEELNELKEYRQSVVGRNKHPRLLRIPSLH